METFCPVSISRWRRYMQSGQIQHFEEVLRNGACNRIRIERGLLRFKWIIYSENAQMNRANFRKNCAIDCAIILRYKTGAQDNGEVRNKFKGGNLS